MRPLRRGTNLSRVAGFNEAVVIDAVRRARHGLSRGASALPRVRRRTGEPSSGTRNNWPT